MIQKRKVFFFEILVYLLILLITKLLSFNFSPQEFIRKKVRKSLEISETLPPLEKKRNLDYREILEKRKIKPVKHRKPISKGITCPTCNAPWEYIYSNARVFSSLQKRKVQKYRCKICGRQWIIPAKVFLPSPLCPFCGRPLNIKKRRKNFDVYKCSNSSCFHRKKYGQRYTYRAFRTDFGRPKERETSPLPDIKRSHFPFQIQAICISLYLCGLSSREVVFFLKSFFSVKISHQTVLNFLYSLASHLGSLLPNLPPSTSNLLIVDEKYIRCEGRWGYLFTCLNERGAILAQYFSPTRSFAGAYAVLYRALSKLSSLPEEITVVTDAFTCYPPAIEPLRLILR